MFFSGFQNPKYGRNFAVIENAIIWNNPLNFNIFIETIQPTLKSLILPSNCYQFRMSISLAENSNTTWPLGLDVYFSQQDFTMNEWVNPSVTPQYSFNNCDTLSTTNWNVISQEISIQDTMGFLTIGWFSNPWTYPNNTSFSSFYYIDNVVLYPCSAQTYVADGGPDQFACKGESVTFSTPFRNEESGYLWLNTSGDTLSYGTDLTVEVSEVAEYYLWQLDF